ncbi:MAG: hypothetical protein KKG99_05900, partial [Bacteroidetes bacterium]|nr:hypothetical protein [Bacteroidota bacterium]
FNKQNAKVAMSQHYLLNIFKGNMVFVGPGPALYNQADLMALRCCRSGKTQTGCHRLGKN